MSDQAVPRAIAGVASRRIKLHIPVTEETVGEVAQVLRDHQPNLSHQRSLELGKEYLEEINKELLKRPVPAPTPRPVSPLAFEEDPMKLEEEQVGDQLP